ncbi:hypothetical protein JCM14076_31880 [Methylosoma difficile]
MSEQSKFIVTYEINYVHRVQVGVIATNKDTAILSAKQAFDHGSIWDDTQEMPLLYDQYIEIGDDSLTFSAEPVADFPESDESVNDIRRKENAFKACNYLLKDIDSELNFAIEVFAGLASVQPNTGLSDFECRHCGRVYDDACECLSDNCPSRELPLS